MACIGTCPRCTLMVAQASECPQSDQLMHRTSCRVHVMLMPVCTHRTWSRPPASQQSTSISPVRASSAASRCAGREQHSQTTAAAAKHAPVQPLLQRRVNTRCSPFVRLGYDCQPDNLQTCFSNVASQAGPSHLCNGRSSDLHTPAEAVLEAASRAMSHTGLPCCKAISSS